MNNSILSSWHRRCPEKWKECVGESRDQPGWVNLVLFPWEDADWFERSKKKVLTIFMLEHCQKQEQLSNLINNLQLGLFHLWFCFRATVNPQSCRNAVLTCHPHNSLSHLLGSWLTITGHWYNLDNWQLILMPPHLAKISFESPSPSTSPSLHHASCFSSSRDSLSPRHRASFSSLCQRHGRRFSLSRQTTLSQKPISSSWLTAQMPSCWNAFFCFAALCRCLREGMASFTDWRFEEQPKKGVCVSFMFAIGVSCRIYREFWTHWVWQ